MSKSSDMAKRAAGCFEGTWNLQDKTFFGKILLYLFPLFSKILNRVKYNHLPKKWETVIKTSEQTPVIGSD